MKHETVDFALNLFHGSGFAKLLFSNNGPPNPKEHAAMVLRKEIPTIEVIHPVCCGMDVHKMSISACLITVDGDGKEQMEIREFGTFFSDLVELRNWLVGNRCPIVAMESTGVYWRPIYNILEGSIEVVLANARHIKNVPGRKTDISDCKWLAGLLRHGLIKASFIPEKIVRQWRDLTTLRKSHVQTVGDYKRRVHKLFETANVKIDSVVSDLFGTTGRNLINLLSSEKTHLTADDIKACAKGSLRSKVKELQASLEGFFEDHHRFQLKGMMGIIEKLELEIQSLDERLTQLMGTQEELLDRLDEIPGINRVAAQAVLSRIGITLEEFSTEANFCSWSGLCPGNNESAGKRKSGRHFVHSHPFKTLIIEIAWAAVKKKGSYYKEKYYRLKARLGPGKAITAIGHRIAKAIYHIIKDGQSFKELGEDYLNNNDKTRKLNNLRKHARRLGFDLVAIEA